MKAPPLTPKKQKFKDKYHALPDRDIALEQLYAQHVTVEKLEAIRKNTATLIWFLIVVPIVISVLYVVLTNQ